MEFNSCALMASFPNPGHKWNLYIKSSGLKLTRSFTSVTLLEGNAVTISCSPNITEAVLFWVFNNSGVNITESTERISLFPPGINHNLTILNPVVADSGIYFCRSIIEEELVEQNISVTIVAGMKYLFIVVFCICTYKCIIIYLV